MGRASPAPHAVHKLVICVQKRRVKNMILILSVLYCVETVICVAYNYECK